MTSRARRPPGRLAPAVLAGQAAAAAAEVEAALLVDPDPTAAAFFDIDNTVVRGASIFHLAMGLAQRKFFSGRDVAGFAWDQVKFRLSGSENAGDMADATEAALSLRRRPRGDEVVQLGRGDLRRAHRRQGLSGRRWRSPAAHLDAGQRVWLVSAAPSSWPRSSPSASGSPARSARCPRLEAASTPAGSSARPLHGPAKAEAVRALAEREGLDLARCAAYSDSVNDIPMLSLVGDPVAVNPDTTLRQHARDLRLADPGLPDRTQGRQDRRPAQPRAGAAGAAIASAPWPATAVAARSSTAARRSRDDAPLSHTSGRTRVIHDGEAVRRRRDRRCMSSW